MVLQRLSLSKTKLLHKNYSGNTGVKLKMIREKALGLNPIQMETFILDNLRMVLGTDMEFINIMMVMLILDNDLKVKWKDTVFISGRTERSMMDSGKMITNQKEFLKMLKLDKFIDKYMKTEKLYNTLRL
jgi:hypothetical protein